MTPLYNAFVYLVWFLATFYIVFFFLSYIFYRHKIFEGRKASKGAPLVSVLVPAYNEAQKIQFTIDSLKQLSYQNVEIILISDGSTDHTASVIRNAITDDPRFKFIDNKENKGKAATLNQGIEIAKGEFIACMDADSSVEPGIIEKTISYFDNDDVGAVTVSVMVKNPKSFLDKVIAMEYMLGLSLFLKVFSHLDSIGVTPGPFSIFRKSALSRIGGFDPENITEDMEIAYRLHKSGYKIKNCIEAKVYTIIPDSFRKIYVQRRRWYSGAINTVVQHRDMIANPKYSFFAFFIPFNFSLIFLGLGLFIASVHLAVSRFFETLLYYRYTNFNFFEYMTFDFNILNYGMVNLLGISIFISTIIFMVVGLIALRHKFGENKMGLFGFPLMFFMYQIFWLGSIVALTNRKKIKWR